MTSDSCHVCGCVSVAVDNCTPNLYNLVDTHRSVVKYNACNHNTVLHVCSIALTVVQLQRNFSNIYKQCSCLFTALTVTQAAVTLGRWCMIVSAILKYDIPKFECQQEDKVWRVNWGTAHLNTACTVKLHLFCHMTS